MRCWSARGALRFAKVHGFKEENLLTDEAREIWLKWKESLSNKDDWLAPATRSRSGHRHEREARHPDSTAQSTAMRSICAAGVRVHQHERAVL